jgi:hypothetical protein
MMNFQTEITIPEGLASQRMPCTSLLPFNTARDLCPDGERDFFVYPVEYFFFKGCFVF